MKSVLSEVKYLTGRLCSVEERVCMIEKAPLAQRRINV